jgi:hypothetical protein
MSRACLTLALLLTATTVRAQSWVVRERVFNDVPNSALTVSRTPDSITISDQGVTRTAAGGLNRHDFRVSSDGTTERLFYPYDTFDLSATITLTGTPESPRKEAGFRVGPACEGLFIVNTDAHEVVAFGGPFPFYRFDLQYFSGDAVTLRLRYLKQGGKMGFIFTANGVNSPFLPGALCPGSWVGGYLQVASAQNNPANGGTAAFANLSFVDTGNGPPPPLTDDELLDRVHAQSCKYSSVYAISSGSQQMIRDSSTNPVVASVAATGFGLVNLCIMAERYGTTSEWTLDPSTCRNRANAILDAILDMQAGGVDRQFAGLPYHFVEAAPGGGFKRNYPSECSTVDGAYMLVGVIAAGEYFGGELKTKARRIAAAVDWSRFLISTPEGPRFSMAWKPESGGGYSIPRDGGYLAEANWDRVTDETIAVVMMALASDPTNADALKALYSWPRVYRTYRGGNGVTYACVPSYFGSMYAYTQMHAIVPFDRLGKDHPEDVGYSRVPLDWWENAVTAAQAARQYAIDHAPGKTPATGWPTHAVLGENSWGLSAAAVPTGGYKGDLGSPPIEANNGVPQPEGIMAPHGAITAMPLMRTSPTESLSANASFRVIRYWYDTMYWGLWGAHGPKDAFDDAANVANVYIGIDTPLQGIAIEQYRTGKPGQWFTRDPSIANALALIFHKGLAPGDLNLDGIVTVDDASTALAIAAGLTHPSPAQRYNGDLNGDGIIDITDGAAIARVAG